MASKKQNRAQRGVQQRRARAAAIAAAHRRRRVRQRIIVLGGLLILAGVAAAVVLLNQGDDPAPESATEIEPVGPSKPCVKLADPLPAGAPDVPIEVGPAPKELVKKDLKDGTGDVVLPGADLTVHYIGAACSTGKIFDSSYSRGAPSPLSLGQVIPGWQQGIPGMKVGGQRLLGIPAALAYGAPGRPPDIGTNEALWFVVEVVEAKPPATTVPAPTPTSAAP